MMKSFSVPTIITMKLPQLHIVHRSLFQHGMPTQHLHIRKASICRDLQRQLYFSLNPYLPCNRRILRSLELLHLTLCLCSSSSPFSNSASAGSGTWVGQG